MHCLVLKRTSVLQRHTCFCQRKFGKATNQSFSGRERAIKSGKTSTGQPNGSPGPKIDPPAAYASLLLRPAIFTGGVCFGSFALAAVVTNKTRKRPSSSLVPSHIDSQELVLGSIVAANLAVFAGWQLSPEHNILKRYFLHYPLSGRSLPLLLW
jgi:hypothetical protein